MEFDHDLADVLDELIDENRLIEGTAVYGVSMQYLHEGGAAFTSKQQFVFDRYLMPLLKFKSCRFCGELAPGSEGRALCSFHRSLLDKSNGER